MSIAAGFPSNTRVFLILAVLLVAPPLAAGVTRIEIEKKLPFAEGRSFDGIGPYQRLLGLAHFAVDPEHAANQQIVDLKLAPRNAQGLVEFSTDLEILAPVDLSKASGTLLYDVNNRGRRMCLDLFNEGADHFLMRRGTIVVWSGWIAQVLPSDELLRLDVPPATRGSEPITGMYRAEIMTNEPATRMSIANRPSMGSYRPTRRGLEKATLTWRLRERDRRVKIPREQWTLEIQATSAPGQTYCLPKIELVLSGGFQPGCIYELIYEAQGPVVQGLGLAGIRDLVSYLRRETSDRSPLYRSGRRTVVKRALGFGISQSGRCLRVLLHEGFTTDEEGRPVFDGLIPHVSGGGLGFFNYRFASPTRYASQHTFHLFPCDLFPFAYGDVRDPLTGRTDGLLRRARAAGFVPRIFHIQNSAEYWHRSGSLVHTDPLGGWDLEIPPEVRIYAVGGAQHGPGDDVPRPRSSGQLSANPTDYRPFLRALFVALEEWVTDGSEPPPSRYPRISEGTLVDWRAGSSGWAPLPGVRYPGVIQQPELLDYGPEFYTRGIIGRHPPRRLGNYRALVPAHDSDNNERGMLLPPTVSVPLGTFTGWNLRHRSIGAESELLRLVGSYIPLVHTTAERRATGDPRRSVAERYRDLDDYLRQFEAAARGLITERYLLEEDLDLLMDRARARRALLEP